MCKKEEILKELGQQAERAIESMIELAEGELPESVLSSVRNALRVEGLKVEILLDLRDTHVSILKELKAFRQLVETIDSKGGFEK